ncbi:MAG: hypothetical protein V2A69_12895 [Pseudomonadota bacterium]
MEKKRVFTDDELANLSKSRLALAKDAIREGDKEEAEKKVQAIYDEFMIAHDLFRDWIADLLSEIGRQFGDETLHEIMVKTVGNYMKPLKELFKKGFRECVEATAGIWRAHFSEFELKEDDEKVTFILKPCGTGGRQLRDGRYGLPLNLLKVKNPQVMTGQSKNCPVYCAHCVSMTEFMLDEKMDFVYVVEVEDGKNNAEHLFHIYKDPAKVPAHIYNNLGRKKPK